MLDPSSYKRMGELLVGNSGVTDEHEGGEVTLRPLRAWIVLHISWFIVSYSVCSTWEIIVTTSLLFRQSIPKET